MRVPTYIRAAKWSLVALVIAIYGIYSAAGLLVAIWATVLLSGVVLFVLGSYVAITCLIDLLDLCQQQD